MERRISYKDVEKALTEAYEELRGVTDGTEDARVAGKEKADDFNIAIVLTDGRTLTAGDTRTLAPLGRIARVPLSVELLSQNTPDELAQKRGCCRCTCGKKPKIAFGAHAIRAVSAVAPQNDADGKYQVLLDRIAGLTDGAPVFSDDLYKVLSEEASAMKMAEVLKDAGYELYDDADKCLDVYAKLQALELSTEQLAILGATVAADGRNPRTGVYAFDGKVAANVVGLMAQSKVGHGCRKVWMMKTGLPAAASFGGTVLAILPGFGAIAVYSPRLCEGSGVSVRGAKALQEIARKLDLNVFASARVAVE